MTTSTVVIPCYNETTRLDPARVAELATYHRVLLVDDGSSDGTGAMLQQLAASLPNVEALLLTPNGGKAEAVRKGLLHALQSGANTVGFTDADFATSPGEMHRLMQRCVDEQRPVVIGSRVELLGHQVQRNGFRHYTGRVFATITSLVLGFAVYDTQCGAKVFADSPVLRDALDRPFVGRWSFDVELLGRLAAPNGHAGFLEVPLLEWHDVAGSKLSLTDSVRSTFELLTVARRLRRIRRH